MTKLKTTATKSRNQRKALNALRTAKNDSNANFSDAKAALQHTEEKVVFLTGRLAEAKVESNSKGCQLEKMTSENRLLTQRTAVLQGKLDAANAEVAVKGAELDKEKAKNAVLAKSLDEATKQEIILNTKITEQRLDKDVLLQDIAAAHEELAAKDAVIKIGQGLFMEKTKANEALRLGLQEANAQLQVSEVVTSVYIAQNKRRCVGTAVPGIW